MRATPVPPAPLKLTGVALAVAVQVDPVCVILTGEPSIVKVVLLAEKLFGGA
jgi:hypothetical protein